MAIHRKIITEYINQVREDLPGTCIHKRAENIIRGYDCIYLQVPKSEYEDIWCGKLLCNTQPNCFCCWAERRPYPKDLRHGNNFIKIEE